MTTPHLKDVQRDPVDEARLLRNWRGVQRRRASRGRRTRWVIGGGAVAFAAAAAALAIVWTTLGGEPEPLTLADGGAFDRVDGAIVLSDGSRITPDDGAELEVLESSAQRVVLRLASGRARFEVTPGGPRRWVVEAGARVEVVGTAFTIDRAPPRVDVEVERGVVLVFAEELTDGVRRLTAGEGVSVVVGSGSESGAESGVVIGSDSPAGERIEGDPPEVDEAPEPAAEAPVARRAAVPTAAELMERADIARLHSENEQATRWLSRILADHPRAPEAAMAAVTLGRLELQLERPRRAVRAFDRALARGLPPSLAEGVRARRVEALARAGRAQEAREAAREYHRRYPSGRWTDEVERWSP